MEETGAPLMEAAPPQRKQGGEVAAVCCAFGAAVGALGFGYSLGFSSPALPAMNGDVFDDLKCGDDDDSANVTGTISSLWSSIINIGAMAGALSGGRWLESLGRRGTLQLVAAPLMAAGWTWTAIAPSWPHLIAARVAVGAGVGVASTAVPVYIAETAPAALRGGLGAVNQLSVTVGILAVYLAGFLLPHSRREYDCGQHVSSIHPSGWRFLAWLGAGVGCALAVVSVLFLPETPVWLATHGRLDAADRALCRLRGGRADPEERAELRAMAPADTKGPDETLLERGRHDDDDDPVEDGLSSANVGGRTTNTTTAEKPRPNDETMSVGGLVAALTSPKTDPACAEPLRLVLTLMVIQQLSGINAIIFYAGDILGAAGVHDRDLGGVVVMAVQVVVTGLACLLVDRLGRRKLLALSLALMTFAAVLQALYFATGAPPAVAILALVIYIAGFSIGLGPLPWLLMPELLPKRARAVASAAATITNWLFSFLVTETFAYLLIALQPSGTFFFFASVCAAGFIYVNASLPETKGLSLNHIEALFAQRASSPGDNSAG